MKHCDEGEVLTLWLSGESRDEILARANTVARQYFGGKELTRFVSRVEVAEWGTAGRVAQWKIQVWFKVNHPYGLQVGDRG